MKKLLILLSVFAFVIIGCEEDPTAVDEGTGGYSADDLPECLSDCTASTATEACTILSDQDEICGEDCSESDNLLIAALITQCGTCVAEQNCETVFEEVTNDDSGGTDEGGTDEGGTTDCSNDCLSDCSTEELNSLVSGIETNPAEGCASLVAADLSCSDDCANGCDIIDAESSTLSEIVVTCNACIELSSCDILFTDNGDNGDDGDDGDDGDGPPECISTCTNYDLLTSCEEGPGDENCVWTPTEFCTSIYSWATDPCSESCEGEDRDELLQIATMCSVCLSTETPSCDSMFSDDGDDDGDDYGDVDDDMYDDPPQGMVYSLTSLFIHPGGDCSASDGQTGICFSDQTATTAEDCPVGICDDGSFVESTCLDGCVNEEGGAIEAVDEAACTDAQGNWNTKTWITGNCQDENSNDGSTESTCTDWMPLWIDAMSMMGLDTSMNNISLYDDGHYSGLGIFGTWTLDADGTTISLVSDDYCDFSQDGDMTQDEDMTESSCLNAGGQWEPSETISGTLSDSELTINVTDSEESECMGATASAEDECTDAGGEWEEADNSCYEFILIGE